MAFKMKRSPVKGKLSNFFSNLGDQLKSNRRDIGGKYKGVKQKDKPRTDVLTKNIKDTSQKGDEAVRPKKATVENKPKSKQTFKQAFAAARKAGKKEFTWKGNPYTTELK